MQLAAFRAAGSPRPPRPRRAHDHDDSADDHDNGADDDHDGTTTTTTTDHDDHDDHDHDDDDAHHDHDGAATTTTTTTTPPPTPVPAVTGLSPTSGPTTVPVTITGTGFTGATGEVNFGAISARRASRSPSDTGDHDRRLPQGTGTVDVRVSATTPSGTSVTGTAHQFTYVQYRRNRPIDRPP